MFNWLVVGIAWLMGFAYVAGITTAMLVMYLFPLPGRVLDICWQKYKDSK